MYCAKMGGFNMTNASSSPWQIITEYYPGRTLGNINNGIQRVLLQVFGMLGHGKSSLINSCLCVMKGEGYNTAPYGSNHGGMTMERKEFELTNHLVMIDNRGFNKLNPTEVLEMRAQFRHLQEFGKVTWTGISIREAYRVYNEEERREPTDLVVPVFVHSCKTVWDENVEKLLADVYSITGIHPIIVITHYSSSKYSGKFIEKLKKLKSTHFIILENYTEKNSKPNPETEGKIVEFLQMCINEAESRIKKMSEEDLSRRIVQQTTQQVNEEAARLKESRDRLQKVLMK
ncbi:unnamed protein product [Ranitomeya imitator]|uniref:G domain-containing protein n=1 Tax=Ranitomeya imitator TaxID=111125 RepID=A0ABN9L652_9NEOB|nr:unnamed protein product [Ranitomeya imitator]